MSESVEPRVRGALTASRLNLPGTTNVRDLAGYPGADAQIIGSGRLLRGEVLTEPGSGEVQGVWTGDDPAAFRDLGLRTIVDLRSEREARKAPSAWQRVTGAPLVLDLPIAEGGEGSDTDFVRKLLSGAMRRFDEDDMTSFYNETLQRCAGTFAAAVDALADAEKLPALVHCSAGKDRTGLLIALILEVLGTPRAMVVEDYALTGVLRPNRIAAYAELFTRTGVDPENARALFEAPAASMEQVLTNLDENYGGAAGFLVEAGRLHPGRLERLRASLLIPAGRLRMMWRSL